MSRTYDIAIQINGQLGNLQDAIRGAQSSLQNLGNSARQSSTQASRAAQNLHNRLQNLNQNLNFAQQFRQLNSGISEFSRQTAQARQNAMQLQAQMQAQQAQVARMRDAFQRLQTARDNRQISAAQLRQARQELRAEEQSLRQLQTQYRQAQSTADSLNNSLRQQTSQLQNLRSAFGEAGIGADNLANHETDLQREIQRTERQLQAQQNFDSARSNFSNRRQNLSDKASNFQDAVGTAQTILSPITDSLKTYAAYDAQMSKVKAVTGATGKDFDDLKAKAKELGATTQFSATEVAEGMVKIGQAGWDKNKIVGGMESMINLSIAGAADFETTADIVTDAMTALGYTAGTNVVDGMGKSVEATQHFADVLAVAASKSNTDIPQMGETFKYAAAAAGTLGYSVDDLALATGLMANAGIKGSNSGTALRSIFTRMATETDATAQAMSMLGISLTEIDPKTGAEKMKSFTNVIKDMRGAFKKLNPEEVAAKMEEISGTKMKNKDEIVGMLQKIKDNGGELSKLDKIKFANMMSGQEALSGFLALVTGSEEDFNNLVASIEKSDGAAKKMADTMSDNLEGDLKKFASAQEAASLAMAEAFEPAARAAANFATNAASGLSTWIAQHQTAVQWIGILAVGLATVIVLAAGVQLAFAAWGFIAGAINLASAAVTAFGARVIALAAVQRIIAVATAAWTAAQAILNAAMMLNPVGLVIAGVIALIAVIAGIISLCPGVSEALSAAWNHPKGAIEGFTQLAKSLINDAVNYVMDRWNTLKSALEHPIDAALNFLDHGDVIGGNVKSGEQIAAESHAASGGGTFGEPQQQIDTSQTQASIDALGQSAQATADTQQNIAQVGTDLTSLSAGFQNIGADFTTLQTGVQGVGTDLTSLQTNAQTSGTELTNFQTNLTATSPPVQQLGTDSTAASGQINQLASSAGSAAGSLSQIEGAASSVASALSSKAAEIGAIHISVPTVTTAQNAKGGIYPKGEFLTTFAEKSPEAAIPLDNSSRAKNLWTQAGKILGILPGNAVPTDSKPKMPENILPEILNPIPTFPQQKIQQAQKSTSIFSRKINLPKNISPTKTFPQNKIPNNILPEILNPIPTFPQQKIQQAQKSTSIFSRKNISSPMNLLDNLPGFGVESQALNGLDFFQNKAGNVGGIFESLLQGIHLPKEPSDAASLQSPIQPPINISITITGNADANVMQDAGNQLGVDLLNKLETWWRDKNHNQARRSFS